MILVTTAGKALIDSGLGYTLLRNGACLQNFLMSAPEIAAPAIG